MEQWNRDVGMGGWSRWSYHYAGELNSNVQDTSNVTINALFYKHYVGIRYAISRRRCFSYRLGGGGSGGDGEGGEGQDRGGGGMVD